MIDFVRAAAWRLVVCVSCFLLAQSSHAQNHRVDGEPPNIIFIFADDQPANCTGYSGNQAIKTPHLDALARRGTVFNNAFVTTAICCSNRACLLTGQPMWRHGITDFRTPLSKEAFARTYPAILRRAGYRTGYLGKYAIGNPQMHPTELALPESEFDYWYGFPQSISFKQTINGETRFLTEVMTEKAIEFLESSRNEPFCLTVALKEPHGPFNYFDPKVANPYQAVELPGSKTFTINDYELQPDFIKQSLNGSRSPQLLGDPETYQDLLRTFYRTVTRADQAVGEILAALDRLELDDNTVVIYSSDHGSLLGDHGLTGKWLMYENSIRVPLIVHDPRPNQLLAKTRNELVLSLDIPATIVALAGLPVPESMDGKDLMPLVRNESPPWRSSFYYEHTYTPEKESNRPPIPRTEGVRGKRWKYVRFPDQEPVYEQLFDLQNDPLEQNNLIGESEHQPIANELRSLCDSKPR
jgi:arylsulfatase A-like enzyme